MFQNFFDIITLKFTFAVINNPNEHLTRLGYLPHLTKVIHYPRIMCRIPHGGNSLHWDCKTSLSTILRNYMEKVST